MAVHVLNAGRASLLLRDDGDPYMTMAAAVGIPPSIVQQIEVHDGQGLAGTVAAKGVSLLGRSASGETFLIAPVNTDERVQGVLNVTRRLGPRHFTSSEMATATSIAQHIATLLQYQRDSMIDDLTGLPNEKAFNEALDKEISRSKRRSRSFAVAYVDVDGLKVANDRYGHAAGDRLLRSVGSGLRRAVRQYDFASRLHGDEFAVILADTEGHDSSTLARRVTELVGSIGLSFFISVGFARFPHDGADRQELMRKADERMYAYKRQNSPHRRDADDPPAAT